MAQAPTFAAVQMRGLLTPTGMREPFACVAGLRLDDAVAVDAPQTADRRWAATTLAKVVCQVTTHVRSVVVIGGQLCVCALFFPVSLAASLFAVADVFCFPFALDFVSDVVLLVAVFCCASRILGWFVRAHQGDRPSRDDATRFPPRAALFVCFSLVPKKRECPISSVNKPKKQKCSFLCTFDLHLALSDRDRTLCNDCATVLFLGCNLLIDSARHITAR